MWIEIPNITPESQLLSLSFQKSFAIRLGVNDSVCHALLGCHVGVPWWVVYWGAMAMFLGKWQNSQMWIKGILGATFPYFSPPPFWGEFPTGGEGSRWNLRRMFGVDAGHRSFAYQEAPLNVTQKAKIWPLFFLFFLGGGWVILFCKNPRRYIYRTQ